jgi:hypothetical protein
VFPSRPSRGRSAAPRCVVRWLVGTASQTGDRLSWCVSRSSTGTQSLKLTARMLWLGWGRPCADRLPRRHPASASGPRFCRGCFQNIERRHQGSINRAGESVATHDGDGKRKMPSAASTALTVAESRHRRLVLAQITQTHEGLKIPETARSPTPGLRHAHGRCSLFLTVQASTSPCLRNLAPARQRPPSSLPVWYLQQKG